MCVKTHLHIRSGATKPTREPDPQLGETTELVQISVAGVVTEDVANSSLGPRINVYVRRTLDKWGNTVCSQAL
jgi:hypothetical protein